MIDLTKFKDDKGRWRTKSLFYENYMDNDGALYSMSDYDKEVAGKKYPSLKLLYLETEDITEYEFATKYLGGWEHWNRLTESYLRGVVDSWRAELELKLRARAIKKAIKNSEEGNFNASRWVAERGWEEKKVGKASKKEIEAKMRKDSALYNSVQEDLERIGLSLTQ